MNPKLAVLVLAALALAAPAAAQPASGRFWGGPDSPGGLFGGFGDPTQLDADRDNRVTHDEIWTYLERRFRETDRNNDGRLSPDELPARARNSPAFRAGDHDEDQHLSQEELRNLSRMWFRARDRNRDRVLTGDELARRLPAVPQSSAPVR